MKRLFIALPIQESTRKQILSVLAEDICRKMPVRWTSLQNLHLTLQFLGDVDEKRIPDLKQILNRIRGPEDRVLLHFTTVGAFPDAAHPRIVWLGIDRAESLIRIQQQITADLTRNGFNPDRKPFKAHLTLGRVKDGSAAGNTNISSLRERFGASVVDDSPMDSIVLFESLLKPGGPIYTSVYTRHLI